MKFKLKQTIEKALNSNEYVGKLKNMYDNLMEQTKDKVDATIEATPVIEKLYYEQIGGDPVVVQPGELAKVQALCDILSNAGQIDVNPLTNKLMIHNASMTSGSDEFGTYKMISVDGVNELKYYLTGEKQHLVEILSDEVKLPQIVHDINASAQTIQQAAELNAAFMNEQCPSTSDLASIYDQFDTAPSPEITNLYNQLLGVARNGGEQSRLYYVQVMKQFFEDLYNSVNDNDIDFSKNNYTTKIFVTLPLDIIVTTVSAAIQVVTTILFPVVGFAIMGLGWVIDKVGGWLNDNVGSTTGDMEYSSCDAYTYANPMRQEELSSGALYNSFNEVLESNDIATNQIIKIYGNVFVIYVWKISNGHIRYEIFLNCIWSPTVKRLINPSSPWLTKGQVLSGFIGDNYNVNNSTIATSYEYKPTYYLWGGDSEYDSWQVLKSKRRLLQSIWTWGELTDSDIYYLSTLDRTTKDFYTRVMIQESLAMYELLDGSEHIPDNNNWAYFGNTQYIGSGSWIGYNLSNWCGGGISGTSFDSSASANDSSYASFHAISWVDIQTFWPSLNYIPVRGALSVDVINSWVTDDPFYSLSDQPTDPFQLCQQFVNGQTYFINDESVKNYVSFYWYTDNINKSASPMIFPANYTSGAWIRLAIGASILATTILIATLAFKKWRKKCRIKAWAAQANADLIAFGEQPKVNLKDYSSVKAWWKAYRKASMQASILGWLGGSTNTMSLADLQALNESLASEAQSDDNNTQVLKKVNRVISLIGSSE